jgi:hypothetical protein
MIFVDDSSDSESSYLEDSDSEAYQQPTSTVPLTFNLNPNVVSQVYSGERLDRARLFEIGRPTFTMPTLVNNELFEDDSSSDGTIDFDDFDADSDEYETEQFESVAPEKQDFNSLFSEKPRKQNDVTSAISKNRV